MQEALPRRVPTTPPGNPPSDAGTFGQRSRGWVQNPRQEEGWRVRVAPPERVRAAPLKLDRPTVRVLGVHDDGGVSRDQAK